MKVFFDVIVALLLLIILSPLVFILLLLVFIEDGFPLLFYQKRLGLNGTEFKIIKIRSMRNTRNKESREFDLDDTSRITKVGRFVRKAKFDELPQLVNVVKGDMSLVGPRPEVKEWVQAYPERWARVHTVRPGITDPASIVYRDEAKLLARATDSEKTYRDVILPHKLDLYEGYIESQTFWGDIQILVGTVLAVIGIKKDI